jgi:hypothetical protein
LLFLLSLWAILALCYLTDDRVDVKYTVDRPLK